MEADRRFCEAILAELTCKERVDPDLALSESRARSIAERSRVPVARVNQIMESFEAARNFMSGGGAFAE